MTVGELKSKLEKYDPEAGVSVSESGQTRVPLFCILRQTGQQDIILAGPLDVKGVVAQA